MIALQGYNITDLLYDGSKTLVYRGRRNSDGTSVAIKLLKNEYPTFTELVQFRNQYAIAKNLDLPGIVRPIALENYRNGFALVMEDFGGVSLTHYIASIQAKRAGVNVRANFQDAPSLKTGIKSPTSPIDIAEFLEIAIAIAHILEGLYWHRVIHKDIKPYNILINPETKEIKLIDFSIASLLPRETQEIQNANILEGTLAYISPEQTGRMNRGIDYRTDFYSLGITFYELLTGQLPFNSSDPLELVHCHIARQPTPPSEVNPAIPLMLNDIIVKLMAKTAENRYQSALGLRYDLEICAQQWQEKGSITPFILGRQDIGDRFIIPERLYGRETEVATLLAAFDRVASASENRGVGKANRKGAGVGAGLAENPDIPQITSQQNPPQSVEVGVEMSVGVGLAENPDIPQITSQQNPPLSSPSHSSEIMLVAGFSGIGKTAVVNEIHKPIVRQRGYFIAGKFDQFKRNIPFSALVQAFQNLVRQLLSENTASVEAWKAKILKALGENGQVIIDVIPELEILIGKQPPAAELAPSAAKNRFNLLFGKFIQVLATPEHPLVIFLDDLQWADSASLKLIQLLTSDINTRYLLLIGAYRDNEVNPAHLLTLTLQEIRASNAIINKITLASLDKPNLNKLIADTLSCTLQKALPLTELVFQKTQGNPFFANQFLKSLYQDGLISFNVEANLDIAEISQLPQNHAVTSCPIGGYWQCDIAKIRELAVTDDVVEFMALQLQKLPKTTQNVLKIAACIGNQFDLATVAIALDKSLPETASDLWKALQEGLILPQSEVYKFFSNDEEGLGTGDWELGTGNNDPLPIIHDQVPSYKFLHDRIQQAAYSLIPQAQKQATHLKIGQLLLSHTPPEEREEKIFEIVNQLNYGVELILNETERYELAQLNLMAGSKAKASTAYAAALEYLTVGRQLLSRDSLRDSGASRWQTQYELTLALYVTAADAAYLSGDFQQMEELATIVLNNARTLLDKVKVYEVQLSAYTAQVKPKQAVKMGLEVLKLLEVNFPENPTPLDIAQELAVTASLFAGGKIADFINLSEMVEPDKQAALRILSSLVSPAYITDPLLLPLIILQMVNLSVRHGNAPLSAFAYGLYGLILSGVVQDIETGYEFGQLALNLVEKFNANSLKTKIFYTVAVHIIHGKHHVKNTLPLLREGYERGLETGELELGYSAKELSQYSYLMGRELGQLEPEIARYSEAIAHLKQSAALNYNQIVHQAVLNLLGKSENPYVFAGDAYNEEKMLPFHIEANDRNGLHYFHFHKMLVCYLFGEASQALANAEKAEQYLDAVTGMLNVPTFYFYDSLARLAVHSESSNLEREEHLLKVKNNQEKMQVWADSAPMNFSHKFYLVEAERFRVLGQYVEAMDAYDRAIFAAQENEYINEEAIAHELAAKFYFAWGKQIIAQTYLTNAYYAYARWGAKAKVEDLKQRYPQLLAPIIKQEMNLKNGETLSRMSLVTVAASSTGSSALLDLATALKASQALSGEIVLNKLLSTLMQVAMENAGAERGVLILPEGDRLAIAAQCIIGIACNLHVEAVDDSANIPITAINYVSRTLETLVIDDATVQNTLAADPYIIESQPKSILCTPIVNQGKLIGILYLENNLTTGAFTPDRLEILKIISSQAAISIENAKLYSEVTESKRKLTQFLEAVPVGVFVVDASGKPYYANQMAQQVLGTAILPATNSENLTDFYQVYQTGTDRLYPGDRQPIVRALRGERSTVDDMEIRKPDKIIPIEVWGTPVYDEKGNIAYAIVAFQDITERKLAETKLSQLNLELEQSLQAELALTNAAARFVPHEFLSFLGYESLVEVKLGESVQKEMSILFSDIRDFTTLSESIAPEDNFKFINAYLRRMEPSIIKNNGFIDKYMGDGIMALFGGNADDAVKASIAMLHRLFDYNQHRVKSSYMPIQIGIGINTGNLMLGTVGGYNRMDGTVISDAVNLASRIEKLTKNYGVSLLISRQTFSRLINPNEYAIRPIDTVKVKGRSEMVTVFEVFDADLPEVKEGKLVTKAIFEEALLLYDRHSFSSAQQLFQECLHINPGDKVAQIYLQRTQQQM